MRSNSHASARSRVRSRSTASKLVSLVVLLVVTAFLFYCIRILYTGQSGHVAERTLNERPAGPSEDLSDTYRPPDDARLPRASSPFLDKVATCDSLDCLREAHMLPRGAAKFNHPHFLIIGFQKVRNLLASVVEGWRPWRPLSTAHSINTLSRIIWLGYHRRRRPPVCTAIWHVTTRRLRPA